MSHSGASAAETVPALPVPPDTVWLPPLPPVLNCPSGLEHLIQLGQVVIKNQTEIIEVSVGLEMSNKYGIKNVHGEMIFFAEEENDWCTLNCCMGCRPFTMKFFNSLGQQPIELLRPWKCWCCCWYCCLQELEVQAPPGTPIGYVRQLWDPFLPIFVLQNEAKEDVLRMFGPLVACGCCNNVTFHILISILISSFILWPITALKKQMVYFVWEKVMSNDCVQSIGHITKQCEGCMKECCKDSDHYLVQFPQDLDVKMKAVMIGACFLIDYIYFEGTEPLCLCTWL